MLSSKAANQFPYKNTSLYVVCYKLVDKVNYNLLATLSPHCDDLEIETVTWLWQPCHKVVTRWKVKLLIWQSWGLMGGVLWHGISISNMIIIDEFIFRPKECRGFKLRLRNIRWLSGGQKCTETYGIWNFERLGCLNCTEFLNYK